MQGIVLLLGRHTGSRRSAWAPCLQEEGELAVTVGDVPLPLRQLLHDQAQGGQGPVDAAGSAGTSSECGASQEAWAPSQHSNQGTDGLAACFNQERTLQPWLCSIYWLSMMGGLLHFC